MYRDDEIAEDTISTFKYSRAGLNAAGIHNIEQLALLLEHPHHIWTPG